MKHFISLAAAGCMLAACGGGGGSPTISQAPTVSISAASTSLSNGGSTTLTWSSTDATSCSASGGWSGSVALSGTQSTGALTQNTTYSLECTGAGGTTPVKSVTVEVTPVSAPTPTAALTVSPLSIASGGTATLTWSSTNATSCTASGGWTGTLAASGTQSTGALTTNTTYSLVCTGAGGTSPAASATVTVVPVPVVTLTASPTSIASGGVSTLTWSSTNATACAASGGWSGTQAISGSKSTNSLTATTTYTLTCTGVGGSSVPVTATVTVVPVPTVTLTASPNPVTNGAASTLTWSSTNATGCTASNSWSGAKASNGSGTSGPVTSNSLFSLTCTGIGGVSSPANVTVNVVPTATLSANPTSVTSGGTSQLTWSSSNATACAASGGWTGTLAASGAQSTAAITATTTYGLTCSGAGGTSSAASATVTVVSGTGAVTLSPRGAQLTVTQSQQFTATVSGGAAVTWTVSGYGSGNSSVGTVSSSGLYTAGTTPGNYTVVATDSADTSQIASAAVAVTDLAGVYTYHNDLSRDGANTQEYALNTSNVNTTSFGKLASCTVDGAISAQPLWVANLIISGTQHNVVFVATQNDSVYAFDADANACALLWHANLIDTAHAGTSGEVAVPNTLVGSGHGDIQPVIGVTGTPVIDPSSGILYVVSKSVTPATSSGTFYTRLHALDITTGNEKSGAPALIQGTFTGNSHTATFVTQKELQRPGLALVNGSVYVGFGAHEDQSTFYGWLMSYKFVAGTLTQTNIVNVAPDASKAGIWMSGGAPAADSNNNIYAITGNGTFDVSSGTATHDDYGDSLVQFSPSLQVTQYFTPSDESGDNANDVDYGAGGAALLADLPAGNVVTHALVTAGKDGILYVLNRDSLGGLGTNNNNAVQTIGFGFPLFATGATWNYNFYIGGSGGNINFYQVDTSSAQLNKTSATNHVYGYGGTSPSVSALATQNGIVWSMDETNFCMGDKAHSCGPAVLLAHDATNANTQLWTSADAPNNADAAGNAIKFNVPTVANGRVYVGTAGNANPPVSSTPTIPGELDIYGLKP